MFDIRGARAAGYGDDDILAEMAKDDPSFDVKGARAAGYSLEEISDEIYKPKPAPAPQQIAQPPHTPITSQDLGIRQVPPVFPSDAAQQTVATPAGPVQVGFKPVIQSAPSDVTAQPTAPAPGPVLRAPNTWDDVKPPTPVAPVKSLVEGTKNVAKSVVNIGKAYTDIEKQRAADQKKKLINYAAGYSLSTGEKEEGLTAEQLEQRSRFANEQWKRISGEVNGIDKIDSAVNAVLDSPALKADPGWKKAEGVRGYLQDVVMMAPQVASQAAVGMATGGTGSIMFMGAQIAGSKYEQLKKEGVAPDRAFGAAVADAAMQAPLEQIGLTKALKTWNPATHGSAAVKEMVESGATEFITEALQNYPDAMADIWAKTPGATESERAGAFIANLWATTKDAIYQGLVAAPMGGATSAAGSGVNAVIRAVKEKGSAQPGVAAPSGDVPRPAPKLPPAPDQPLPPLGTDDRSLQVKNRAQNLVRIVPNAPAAPDTPTRKGQDRYNQLAAMAGVTTQDQLDHLLTKASADEAEKAFAPMNDRDFAELEHMTSLGYKVTPTAPAPAATPAPKTEVVPAKTAEPVIPPQTATAAKAASTPVSAQAPAPAPAPAASAQAPAQNQPTPERRSAFDDSELLAAQTKWNVDDAGMSQEDAAKMAEADLADPVRKRLMAGVARRVFVDPLTQLGNRAYAEHLGLMKDGQTVDKDAQTPAVAIDIDHFKKVNDENGHPAGDAVLAELGKLLNGIFKARGINNVVALRTGGEEMAIVPKTKNLLTPTEISGILSVVDEARGLFKQMRFTGTKGEFGDLTFSAGYGNSLGAADEQLYAAKEAGRAVTFKDGSPFNGQPVPSSDAGVRPVPPSEAHPQGSRPAPAEDVPVALPEPGFLRHGDKAEWADQDWYLGKNRPLVADPTSTLNEYRFRLAHPIVFEANQTAGQPGFVVKPRFAGMSGPGVSFVVGRVNGKEAIQQIRFNKSKMNWQQASQWIQDNAEKLGRPGLASKKANDDVQAPAGPDNSTLPFSRRGGAVPVQAARPSATDPAEVLRGGIEASLGTTLDDGDIVEVPTPDSHRAFTSAIEQASGKPVVFVRLSDKLQKELQGGIDGAHWGGYIFIDESSNAPISRVAFHEVYHSIKETDPALAKQIDEFTRNNLTDAGRAAVEARAKREGRDSTYGMNEVMADHFADMAEQPGFWQKLYEYSPKVCRKLASELYKWMNKFTRGFAGADRVTSDKWFKDAVAQRDLAAKIFALTMKSSADPASLNQAGDQLRFLFAGRSATGFDRAERKFSSTVDKQERFEISDKGVKAVDRSKADKAKDTRNRRALYYGPGPKEGPEFDAARERLRNSWNDMARKRGGGYPLSEVFDHPELYKQYPWLADTKVRFYSQQNDVHGFATKTGDIGVNTRNVKSSKQLLSTILHEVQHLIQAKEGFAQGSSPLEIGTLLSGNKSIDNRYEKLIDRQKKIQERLREIDTKGTDYTKPDERRFLVDELEWVRSALRDRPREIYQNTAGEIEARDVSARSQMTEEQRAGDQPLASQQIKKSDMVVRTKEGDLAEGIRQASEQRVAAAPAESKVAPNEPNGLTTVETDNTHSDQQFNDVPADIVKDIDADEATAAQLDKVRMGDLDTIRFSRKAGEEQTHTPQFKQWFGDWQKDPANASKVVDKDGKPRVFAHATSSGKFDATFKSNPVQLGIHFGTPEQAADRLFYTTRKTTPAEGSRTYPVYLSIKNPLRLPDLGDWRADNVYYGLKELKEFEGEIRQNMTVAELRSIIKRHGYDGVVYKNTGEVGGSEPYVKELDEATAAMIASQKRRGKPLGTYDLEDQKTPEYLAQSKAHKDYEQFREQNAEDSYIAFSPNQIKSATGNSGAFSRATNDIRFSRKKQKWDVDYQETAWGKVNKMLSQELSYVEAILGPLPEGKTYKAPGSSGAIVTSANPTSIMDHVLANKARIKDLANRKNSIADLVQKYKPKNRDLFTAGVNHLRDHKVAGGKADIWGMNDKAFATLDQGLLTCHPSTQCQECYAAGAYGMRRGTVDKLVRNTLIMIAYPKEFGRRAAKEMIRTPMTTTPYFRIHGAGDLTTTEQVEAYNEMIANLDRPIQIFSRHHEMLGKLKATQRAPILRMGSVDAHLYKEYGKQWLLENMEKRGIANAWLYTSEDELPLIKGLYDKGAIGLVLCANHGLYETMPEEYKGSNCPCDAGERGTTASCRRCAYSMLGCFMPYAEHGVDAAGKLWKLTDPNAPADIVPMLSWTARGVDLKKGYREIAATIFEKGATAIQIQLGTNRVAVSKGDKPKPVVVKDYLNNKEVIATLKPNDEDGARAWQETLRQSAKKIREGKKHGTLVGGEIQPEIRFSRKPGDEQTRTPQFKQWFGDWENSPETASKVVDKDGKPLVVYHGTTHKFSAFDPTSGNIENDFGRGIYLTSSPADVSSNYAGVGPDLTNRIEKRAEEIFNDLDEQPEWNTPAYKKAMQSARRKAEKELSGGSANVMPVYVDMKNPLKLGGENETRFEMSFDEDTGIESGNAVEFLESLRRALLKYDDVNIEKAMEDIGDDLFDGRASDVIRKLKESEGIANAMDENGNLAASELVREAIEGAGYDGIIDNTVNVKFGSERRTGKSMAGMDENTVHVIAFSPNQIKSATGNSGAFSSATNDIRFSKKTESKDLPSIYSAAASREKNTGLDASIKKAQEARRRDNFFRWAIQTVSSRLESISPEIRDVMQNHISKTMIDISRYTQNTLPLIKGISKMTKEDEAVFDIAAKNADEKKVNELVKKYSLEDQYKKYRETMDALVKRAQDAGYDIGYLAGYFPRIPKDTLAFRAFLQDSPEWWGPIQNAIVSKEQVLGRPLTDEEKDRVVSLFLQGHGATIALGKTANMQLRSLQYIDNDINDYLVPVAEAIPDYIESMVKRVARKELFGHAPAAEELELTQESLDDPVLQGEDDINQVIGNWVRKIVEEKKMPPEKQDELVGLLRSYFNYKPTDATFALIKNIGYATSMGSGFSSMFSQMADSAFTFYTSPGNAPAAIVKAFAGKTRYNLKDLGIEDIAAEFRDVGKMAKILDRLLGAVGLKWGDKVFKSAFIEANLQRFKGYAKKDKWPTGMKERITKAFGDEAPKLFADLATGQDSDNVRMLLLNEASKFQPLTLLQVPKAYLDSPRGRIWYALKTYQIAQMNAIWDEAARAMRMATTPKDWAQAFTKMLYLIACITMANAGTNWIKDRIFMRKTSLGEDVTDALLSIVGVSRYIAWKIRQTGLKATLFNIAAPPLSWADYVGKDIGDAWRYWKGENPDFALKNLNSLRMVPIVGQEYFWWFGGGRKSIDSRSEKFFYRDQPATNKAHATTVKVDRIAKKYRQLVKEDPEAAAEFLKSYKTEITKQAQIVDQYQKWINEKRKQLKRATALKDKTAQEKVLKEMSDMAEKFNKAIENQKE